MSRFITKFIAGGALTAGAVWYYKIDVRRTTERLSSDLHALSQQLVQVKHDQARPAVDEFPAPIPTRSGVKEGIKQRWNETVLGAVDAVRTTQWSAVAATAYNTIKEKVSQAKDKAETPAAPTEQARQV